MPFSFTSRRLPGAALAVAAATVAMPSHGQDAPPGWGLGVVAGQERSAYRDFDDKVRALPFIMYENQWVSFVGPRLDLKLPPVGDVSFRLRLRYAGEGYEAEDSPYFTGMDERKDSVWLGGAAVWRTSLANLSAELVGDVASNSKGTQFKLQAERRFQFGNTDITPRVGATWLDSKYVDYYYGVKATEARADRAFHEGESTVNLEAGVRVGHLIAQRHLVFVDVSGTRLGSGIRESPLVERRYEAGARVGYMYRF